MGTGKKIIICIFLFLPAEVFAQTYSSRSNAISFELGKSGVISNITYDKKLNNAKAGVRVYAGSNFSNYLEVINAGVGGYILFGKNKSWFESGIDIGWLKVEEISDDQRGFFTLIQPDYNIETYQLILNAGFRRYGKSTLFRAGISPSLIKDKILPGGYISFGFTF